MPKRIDRFIQELTAKEDEQLPRLTYQLLLWVKSP